MMDEVCYVLDMEVVEEKDFSIMDGPIPPL